MFYGAEAPAPLAHHTLKEFTGDDRPSMLSCGNEFAVIIGFNGKTGMFFILLDEGGGDGDALSESSHTGVVDIDVLSDGEALICVEYSIDELGGGDFHPLDEDVSAEQIRERRVEGVDAVGGVDGKRFGMGCGFHEEIIAWLDGGLGIIWIRN